MDALPPTLDAPPAIVQGTGLSRDMIGWHRCWQFRDHIPFGFLKAKVTSDLDHVKGKDFFRNLLDDDINMPSYEYGSLMYISDKKGGKNQEEDARRRVFIINKSRKYYFFLNQYFMTNHFFESFVEDGELRNALKRNIVSIKNDNKGEILKINNFLAPNDKIVSLHKEMQSELPYFRDYNFRPIFYPDTVEKMWRKENNDWPKAGVDIFDFIKKYDGLIMVELRADGYWMLGKKFLYVYTQGDWVSTATKEIYKKINYVLAGNDEVSTASNDPVANTIISYLSIFSHYGLKILEKERSWVQRWQPIPVKRCTVAFKPLVEDPAMPEHLKPIFPAISR